RLLSVLALRPLAQLEVALLSGDKDFALYSLLARKLRGNALVVGHCRQPFSFLSSSAFSASIASFWRRRSLAIARPRRAFALLLFLQFSICACRCRDEVVGFRHRSVAQPG